MNMSSRTQFAQTEGKYHTATSAVVVYSNILPLVLMIDNTSTKSRLMRIVGPFKNEKYDSLDYQYP